MWRCAVGRAGLLYLLEDVQGGKKAGQMGRRAAASAFPLLEAHTQVPMEGEPLWPPLGDLFCLLFRAHCVLAVLISACVFKEVELAEGGLRQSHRSMCTGPR